MMPEGCVRPLHNDKAAALHHLSLYCSQNQLRLTTLLCQCVADNTPVWVKWILWINPVWYVQQALAVNEFDSPRWQTNLAADGQQTVGQVSLHPFSRPSM